MTNLAQNLREEIERNKALLRAKDKAFGVRAIEHEITLGEKALESGDAVAQEKAYDLLKRN